MSSSGDLGIPEQNRKALEALGYLIGTPINSGSYAQVFRATRKGEPCAVKVLNLAMIEKNEENSDYRLKFLPRELYVLKKLKHPNLVNIYDIYSINKTWVVIFMELADGGDLLDLIKAEGNWLAEARARTLFTQFGDGVRYMHSVFFAHRDIKCENILLTRDRTVSKLTDFGFARSCLDAATGNRVLSGTYCGTTAYSAPEVIKGTPYNPMKADVWSTGVVLFVMLNNRFPFTESKGNDNNEKMLKRQNEGKYNYRNKALTQLARQVISLLFTPNAAERPSMVEVFTHPWFATPRS